MVSIIQIVVMVTWYSYAQSTSSPHILFPPLSSSDLQETFDVLYM